MATTGAADGNVHNNSDVAASLVSRPPQAHEQSAEIARAGEAPTSPAIPAAPESPGELPGAVRQWGEQNVHSTAVPPSVLADLPAHVRRSSKSAFENVDERRAIEEVHEDFVRGFDQSFRNAPHSAIEGGPDSASAPSELPGSPEHDALFFDRQLDDPQHDLNAKPANPRRGTMQLLDAVGARPSSGGGAEAVIEEEQGSKKGWARAWFGPGLGLERRVSRQESLAAAGGEGEQRKRAFVDRRRQRGREKLADAEAVTCCVLSRGSLLRGLCWRTHHSKAANTFFMLANISNTLAIAVAPDVLYDEGGRVDKGLERNFDMFDIVCVAILGVEVAVGIAALGTRWWLPDFHKLDALVLVASIVEFICRSFGITSFTLRPFRLVRIFRPLSRIAVFAEIRRILATLRAGLSQLVTVFAMLVIFLAAFSIFGMAVFRSAFRRRCVTVERQQRGLGCTSDFADGWSTACSNASLPGTVARGQEAVSGGFPFFSLCEIKDETQLSDEEKLSFPYDPDGWTEDGLTRGIYHTCQREQWNAGKAVTQTCVSGANPGFGFNHFDHVGGAMLAVSQVAVPDAHYSVLHYSLESEPTWLHATWAMHLLITCICTFLLLSLFVAVVTGTFKRVREEAEELHRSAIPDMVQRGTSSMALARGNQVAPSMGGRGGGGAGGHLLSVRQSAVHSMQQAAVDEDDVACQHAVQSLVRSEVFRHVSSAVIVLHAVSMAMLGHGAGQAAAGEHWLYGACSLALIGETALRFVGAGSAGVFWSEGFHRFEVIVGAVNLAGWLVGPRHLKYLPAFRLYRLMEYFPTLYALLLSTIEAVPAILNLCFFIGGVALCFAITGRYVVTDMEAFASFRSAMLTVFQLLMGDSWSNVLYSAMAAQRTNDGQVFACLLILGWFVLSKMVVSNIFVSIIIENFDVSATINSIREEGRIAAFRSFLWRLTLSLRQQLTALEPPDNPDRRAQEEAASPQKARRTGYVLLDGLRETHASVNLTKSLLGSVASSVNSVASLPASAHASILPSTPAVSRVLEPVAVDAPPPAPPPDAQADASADASTPSQAVELQQSHDPGATVVHHPPPRPVELGVAPLVSTADIHQPRGDGGGIATGHAAAADSAAEPGGGRHDAASGEQGSDIERMASHAVAGANFGSGAGNGGPGLEFGRRASGQRDEGGGFAHGNGHGHAGGGGGEERGGGREGGSGAVGGGRRGGGRVESSGAGKTRRRSGGSVDVKRARALGLVRAMTIKRLVKRASQLEDPERALEEEEEEEAPEATLCCLWPRHPLRRWAVWLEEQWAFNAVVGLAIAQSCLISALVGAYDGSPVGSAPAIPAGTVTVLDAVSTGVFTVEFLAKVTAFGAFFTRDAYFKSSWNVVDFIVLLFAWVDTIGVAGVNGAAGKVFRLTRALRPLRVMKRNAGMRQVIDALFLSLAPVMYVVLFSISTIVVFSIIGQGLFGGRLKYCTTPGAEYPQGKVECSGLHVDGETGVMLPRVWQNPDFHFDGIADSLLTLFRVNTVKYVPVMQAAMDITEIDVSPKHNCSPSASIFFVTYLVVGALFVWNLFVGFIVDGFHFIKGKSLADRRFEHFLRQLRNHRPKLVWWKRPRNNVSAYVRGIVDSERFQLMSMCCVLCNVGFMLADHRHADATFQLVVEIQNIVFCTELVMEVILFTIGHGLGGFVSDPWKGFDLFIAVGTLAGLLSSNPQISQPANAFRLLRVLRLMTLIRPIRIILETLLASLPQLGNILLLLLLIYSMFAVVAVQLFGTTRFGTRLGPTANFQTWASAMRVCYQMLVGDEWHEIMVDASVRPPFCTEVFDPDVVDHYYGPKMAFGDCGTDYAQVFFILFKLLGEAVMLNLFIGMILDNFSYITDDVVEIEDDQWTNGASGDQIMDMVKVFRRFDAGTGYIPLTAIRSFVLELPQPLGFRNEVFNDVAYGRIERAVEKLILAELHLCVRTDRETEQELVERWWTKSMRKAVRAVTGKRRARFCQVQQTSLQQDADRVQARLTRGCGQAVRFEETMLTMLYWRKPDMVPDALKLGRQSRIQEILLMSYAITLKNFFSRLVAKRRKQRVQQGLEKLLKPASSTANLAASAADTKDALKDEGASLGLPATVAVTEPQVPEPVKEVEEPHVHGATGAF